MVIPVLAALSTLLLPGCGARGFEVTHLDDVQVVSVVTEPAEAAPGDRVRVTAYVANPDGVELEAMFWTCIPVDDGCAEASFATQIEEWVTVGSVVDGVFTTSRQIPEEAAPYLPEDGSRAPVPILMLVCETGRCPIFDRVRHAMDTDGVPGNVAHELSRPEDWLVDLPISGVALATRQFIASRRGDNTRNQNPVFDPRFAEALQPPLSLPPGGEIDLAFQVTDPNNETVYAFPFTTVGAFTDHKVKVEDDAVRLWLQAPDEDSEGRVWVVFDDRDGGLAVYVVDAVVGSGGGGGGPADDTDHSARLR